MELSSDNLFSKKNLISFLILAILVLGIPIAVKLAQQQQQLQSQASVDTIRFSGPSVNCDPQAAEGEVGCTTTDPAIRIELNSPFGPPQGATGI